MSAPPQVVQRQLVTVSDEDLLRIIDLVTIRKHPALLVAINMAIAINTFEKTAHKLLNKILQIVKCFTTIPAFCVPKEHKVSFLNEFFFGISRPIHIVIPPVIANIDYNQILLKFCSRWKKMPFIFIKEICNGVIIPSSSSKITLSNVQHISPPENGELKKSIVGVVWDLEKKLFQILVNGKPSGYKIAAKGLRFFDNFDLNWPITPKNIIELDFQKLRQKNQHFVYFFWYVCEQPQTGRVNNKLLSSINNVNLSITKLQNELPNTPLTPPTEFIFTSPQLQLRIQELSIIEPKCPTTKDTLDVVIEHTDKNTKEIRDDEVRQHDRLERRDWHDYDNKSRPRERDHKHDRSVDDNRRSHDRDRKRDKSVGDDRRSHDRDRKRDKSVGDDRRSHDRDRKRDRSVVDDRRSHDRDRKRDRSVDDNRRSRDKDHRRHRDHRRDRSVDEDRRSHDRDHRRDRDRKRNRSVDDDGGSRDRVHRRDRDRKRDRSVDDDRRSYVKDRRRDRSVNDDRKRARKDTRNYYEDHDDDDVRYHVADCRVDNPGRSDREIRFEKRQNLPEIIPELDLPISNELTIVKNAESPTVVENEESKIIDYSRYFSVNDIDRPLKSDEELKIELLDLIKTEMYLKLELDTFAKESKFFKKKNQRKNQRKNQGAPQGVTATSENDEDIEVGYQTIMFKCPLSLARMKYPSKGIQCTHFQCFDLESFFTMYKKFPAKCGWCNMVIKNEEHIQIDSRTLYLIDKYKTSKGCSIDSKGSDYLLESLNENPDDDSDNFSDDDNDTPNFSYAKQHEPDVIDLDTFEINPGVFDVPPAAVGVVSRDLVYINLVSDDEDDDLFDSNTVAIDREDIYNWDDDSLDKAENWDVVDKVAIESSFGEDKNWDFESVDNEENWDNVDKVAIHYSQDMEVEKRMVSVVNNFDGERYENSEDSNFCESYIPI